jgi:TonB family protein
LFFIGKKSVELQLPQVSNSGTTIVMEDEPTEKSIITVKRTAPGKISRDIDVYPEPEPDWILGGNGFQLPSYPGGPAEMCAYIAKKVNVDRAVDLGIAGLVVCDVIIDREGNVQEVKLMQGVDTVLDNEVIAALRQMERWIPAINNGKRISMKVRVPFKLEIAEQEFVDNYHLMPSSDKKIK